MLNDKQQLRARIRELSRLYQPGDAAVHRDAILNLPEWKKAETVLLYHPLQREVDLMPLVSGDNSRRFFFPRIENETLGLYRYSPECTWITGPYGLKEPDPATWEKVSPGEIDLALIPGVAFDRAGGRLGQGAGFYDRLLGQQSFQGMKIGVCWFWQLLESVPCEHHDIRMDLVISGKK